MYGPVHLQNDVCTPNVENRHGSEHVNSPDLRRHEQLGLLNT